jgi:hypothetical protein
MADQGKPTGQDVAGEVQKKPAAPPIAAPAATARAAPAGVPVQGAGAKLANESSPLLGQTDIEALLKQNVGSAAKPSAGSARGTDAARGDPLGNIAAGDIDFLINQAEQALASINSPADNDPPPRRPKTPRSI